MQYQVLFKPVTDANLHNRSHGEFAQGPWLTRAAMEWFWNADERQLGGVRPAHVGRHVREILQQMQPIRHPAGRGRPEAPRFRIRLCTIPPEDLDPGMRLQPLGGGSGLPVGKQAKGSRRARSSRTVP